MVHYSGMDEVHLWYTIQVWSRYTCGTLFRYGRGTLVVHYLGMVEVHLWYTI